MRDKMDELPVTDETGRPTVVLRFTSQIDSSTLGERSSCDGLARYETINGEKLTFLGGFFTTGNGTIYKLG